jgi:hypothetical protein
VQNAGGKTNAKAVGKTNAKCWWKNVLEKCVGKMCWKNVV